MMKWPRKVLTSLRDYQHHLTDLRAMETFAINQERLIYQCPLDESKRRNLARQQVNRSLLNLVEFSSPHILHVGVTTQCNLSCPACPTGTASLGRPGEHLDFGLYSRTVDALRDSLLFMLFWDWGEPLLHSRLPEMIEHAGKSGIQTVISTNGNVVYSPERLERLVRAQPSTIIVCVDGADQETYQSYRSGGRLEKVLQTIQRLAETKERLGQSWPLIEFRSLATKGTESQMPELLKLAQKSGADLFTVKTLRPYNYRKANLDDTLAPENETLSRYRYEGRRREAKHRRDFVSQGPLTCAKPLYAPTLNSDGTLTFCSYAQQPNEVFGTLEGPDFAALWKNSASRTRRRDFLKTGGTLSCQTCYFRSHPSPTIVHQVPLRPLPVGVVVEEPQTPEAFLENF